MSIRPALILSVTTCAVLVAAPATASYVEDTSRTVRAIDDPMFDVVQPSEQNGAYEDYVLASGRTTGDITRFEVDHRRHRVGFTIATQELVRPVIDDTYEAAIVGVTMRTDDGWYDAYAVLDSRSTRTYVLVGPRATRPHRCPGKAASFDEVIGIVTISVPRHCLGTPAWVRASAFAAYSWPGGGDSDYYIDYSPDQAVDGPPRFLRRAWHPTS